MGPNIIITSPTCYILLRRLRLLRKIVDTHYYIKKQLAEKTQELPLLGRKKTKNFSPQPLSLGLDCPPEALSVAVQRGPLLHFCTCQDGSFPSQNDRKYAQSHLKNGSKGRKNAFYSFPDLQNPFLDQKSRGRFFHPDGPIFDPYRRGRAGGLKKASRRPKIGLFTAKMVFSGLRSGFFVFLDPKMRSRVTFLAV